MGVKKFAYCVNSHNFDDTPKNGELISDYPDGETKEISYTPFLKNLDDFPINLLLHRCQSVKKHFEIFKEIIVPRAIQ